MMTSIYICCAVLTVLWTFYEVARDNCNLVYNKRFRAHQLRALQARYPELQKMTWPEIEQTYAVDKIYRDMR